MSRPRRGHPLMQLWIAVFHRKLLLPILPVAVLDENGDGRSDGFPVPYAGKETGRIALDLHASAATVALLPAPQFVVHEARRDLQACRQAREERDQRLPVRLS